MSIISDDMGTSDIPVLLHSQSNCLRSRLLVMTFLVLLTIGGGCSIPLDGKGRFLTVGYMNSTADQNITRTIIPGLDLRLGTSHDGLSVGYSSVTIARPLTNSQIDTSLNTTKGWRFSGPLGIIRETTNGVSKFGWFIWKRSLDQNRKPCFIAADGLGLGFLFNQHSRGINIGYESETWTVIPPQSNGSFELLYRTKGCNSLSFVDKNDQKTNTNIRDAKQTINF